MEARLSHHGTPNGKDTVDIGVLLDTGRFTLYQKAVVLMAALSIVFDGFDSQLIGYAIPHIVRQWKITRGAFAPVVAAGLVGMGIGSACAGLFADRFGRRWAVLGSVFLFGSATCAIGFAPNLLTIGILRFVAGLGIGGALPNSTTVTAEFTPAHRRTVAVTVTIICVALGGMFAGLFANAVLIGDEWRKLFFIGGALPLALGVVLLFTLPESPRYLARFPRRWPELERLLVRMSRPTVAGATFSDRKEEAAQGAGAGLTGFTSLFRPGFLRDTLALWSAFFLCLLAVYSVFSWLPTMLTAHGMSSASATSGLTAYNLGGVIGAVACALAIVRFGSKGPMLLCCAGAAASALFAMGVDARTHGTVLITVLGVHGLFVNAVQSTMYALCAYIYPTAIRATGTASALAVGRVGAVLSGLTGAAVITSGGPSAYLALLAVAMTLALVALAVVKQHIPPFTNAPADEKQGHKVFADFRLQERSKQL